LCFGIDPSIGTTALPPTLFTVATSKTTDIV